MRICPFILCQSTNNTQWTRRIIPSPNYEMIVGVLPSWYYLSTWTQQYHRCVWLVVILWDFFKKNEKRHIEKRKQFCYFPGGYIRPWVLDRWMITKGFMGTWNLELGSESFLLPISSFLISDVYFSTRIFGMGAGISKSPQKVVQLVVSWWKMEKL